MASDGSYTQQRERRAEQQPVLPSIFDVLGEEVSSPFWHPSPSNTCSQRPNTLRSFSYPAQHVDLESLIRVATSLIEASQIAPSFAQGWFQPENDYHRRLERKLAGLSLDEIVTAFFYRDQTRALYGDRVIRPRRHAPTPPAVLEDPEDLERLEKSKGIHQKQEEMRRDRHRECQHDSHERCPEVAAKCGAEHALQAKPSTRAQAGKGPGKDEQLYSSIYTQEMAGKVVQALNERRLRAENMVRLLLQILQRQQNSSFGASESHQDRGEAVCRMSFSRPSYAGTKRTRDDPEERTWTRIRHNSDGIDSHASSSTAGDSMWK